MVFYYPWMGQNYYSSILMSGWVFVVQVFVIPWLHEIELLSLSGLRSIFLCYDILLSLDESGLLFRSGVLIFLSSLDFRSTQVWQQFGVQVFLPTLGRRGFSNVLLFRYSIASRSHRIEFLSPSRSGLIFWHFIILIIPRPSKIKLFSSDGSGSVHDVLVLRIFTMGTSLIENIPKSSL